MRRLLLGLAVLSLVLGAPNFVRSAYAHGGQYRGPSGEVPPDSRKPEDPPPPDTGGGTPTPPDGGGGTPTPPDGGGTSTPPDGGTPTPPDKGPTPGGGVSGPTVPGGGTRTGGKAGPNKGPSYDSWLFWWNYNKDEILNIKKRVREMGGASGSASVSLVAGGNTREGSGQRVTDRVVQQKVVPVLREFAANSKVNFDIQSAAILSLAKIGVRDEIPFIMSVAKNQHQGTEKYHKVVEESAALALGIMQERTPEVRKFLVDLALDDAAPTRTRAFAAIALGLLGDREGAAGQNAESLAALKSLVTRKSANRDIPCAALMGIGLLGDRSAVNDLLKWLAEEKAGETNLDDVALSYVAAALGKIGQPGLGGPETHDVVDALREQLVKKNTTTRRSAAIALGQVAPQGDEKVQMLAVRHLSDLAKLEGKVDTQTINFGLVSLGRIAGVKPAEDGSSAGCPAAVREKALATLTTAFEKGSQQTTKAFASLGVALAAMDLDAAQKAPIQEKIREELGREKSPEVRGAYAISLGMLRDLKSSALLQDILKKTNDERVVRGAAAVALGLMQDNSARDLVRATLAENENRELRVDAAIAAGLLVDQQAVTTLVSILEDKKSSQFILGSAAMALGQIGNEKAVDPLVRILRDDQKDYPDLTRALAAVALGQIGDKSDIPVLSRASKDVNYRAYVEAIGELLTII